MNFSANPTHTHRDIYMLIHNLTFPLHIYVHIILSFYPLYFKKNVHVYVYVCIHTHTSHMNFFLAGFPHKQSLAKLLPELSKGDWGSRKAGRRPGALQSVCFSLWWCCWGSQGILSSFMHSWVQMTRSKLAITLCILKELKNPRRKRWHSPGWDFRQNLWDELDMQILFQATTTHPLPHPLTSLAGCPGTCCGYNSQKETYICLASVWVWLDTGHIGRSLIS